MAQKCRCAAAAVGPSSVGRWLGARIVQERDPARSASCHCLSKAPLKPRERSRRSNTSAPARLRAEPLVTRQSDRPCRCNGAMRARMPLARASCTKRSASARYAKTPICTVQDTVPCACRAATARATARRATGRVGVTVRACGRVLGGALFLTSDLASGPISGLGSATRGGGVAALAGGGTDAGCGTAGVAVGALFGNGAGEAGDSGSGGAAAEGAEAFDCASIAATRAAAPPPSGRV